jgi:hypothetical protein
VLYLFACQQTEITEYNYSVEESVSTLDAAKLAVAADIGLTYLGDIKSSELYQIYEFGIQNGDGMCPGLFDAVEGSMAWNNDCQSIQQWDFAGRAQVLYFEDSEFENIYYEKYGYFISNAVITDPLGGLLLMQGYGDLRQNTEEVWMELFGSFAYTGTNIDSDWLNDEASISLKKTYDINMGSISINGGYSRYSVLPDGIAGIVLDNVELDISTQCSVIDGQFSILGTNGDRFTVQLNPGDSCVECSTDYQDICWDLTSFAEVESW